MNFTAEICRLLSTELEPSDDKYACFNTGGVEVEVGEFLFGLVRMMKPAVIVETGTHKGISAAYMAAALKDNNFGNIHTIEFLKPNYETAQSLFDALGLTERVAQYLNDALEAKIRTDELIDILFLDTEPQTRFAEFERFYDRVRPGGIIMIHDLHPHLGQIANEEHGFAWPYGPVPAKMQKLIKSVAVRPVHFRTPRGLTLFYKVAPEDYQA